MTDPSPAPTDRVVAWSAGTRGAPPAFAAALQVRPLALSAGPEIVALLRVQRAAYAVEAALIGSDAIPGLHEDATALASTGETVLGAWLPGAPATGSEPAATSAAQRARGPAGALGSPVAPATVAGGAGRSSPVAGARLAGAVGFERTGDTVTIRRLVVRPALFRRGIATALLDALDRAQPDADRLLVATGSANAPALALYHRRGLTPTGERTAAGGVRVTDLERRRTAP